MAAVFEKATTIYKKGQTTVPVEVRNALGVTAGDRLTFRVERDGTVLVRKAEDREDPVLGAFLSFLADEFQHRSGTVQGIGASLETRLRELTEGIEIDRENDRIEGDVGL
jgi:antitoxin PrlF